MTTRSACLTLLLTLRVLAQPVAPPNVGQRELFSIIDAFDPGDTSDLPFVKVTLGSHNRLVDRFRSEERYGFLLSQKGRRFTVRWLDGCRSELSTTLPGLPGGLTVWHEPADLSDYAKTAGLEVRRLGRQPSHRSAFRPALEEVMGPRGVVLVVARECARRGMYGEMHSVWSKIRLDRAREELAAGFLRRITIEISERKNDWKRILDRHRLWLASFGEHEGSKVVAERVRHIDSIVRANDARRGQPIPNDAKSLVATLHDADFLPSELTFFSGGYPVQFELANPTRKTDPANRLHRLGLRGVPHLIRALENPKPTRRVWYISRWGGGLRVDTVGTVARRILSSLSSTTFWGTAGETRSKAEAWWSGIASAGEEAHVVARARDGDPTAISWVIDHFPKHVGAAIDGIRKISKNEDWPNYGYCWDLDRCAHQVEGIARLERESDTSFLRWLARSACHAPARIAAADALLDRGHRGGLVALLDEWRHGVFVPGLLPQLPSKVKARSLTTQADLLSQQLVTCFLRSGDLVALRAVNDRLDRRKPSLRAAVVKAALDTRLGDVLARAKSDQRDSIAAAAEEILITLLGDPVRQPGQHELSRGEQTSIVVEPRTADLAAEALCLWWPQRYEFSAGMPTRARDVQIARIRSKFQAQRGLPKVGGRAEEPVDRGASNVLRSISVESSPGIPREELRRTVEGMKNRPVQAADVVAVLRAAQQSHPDGLVSLALDRLATGGGLGLTVRLSDRPVFRKGVFNWIVDADREYIARSARFNDPASDQRTFAETHKVIDAALAMKDSPPFEVRLRLLR